MKNLIKSLLLCSILSVTCNVFAPEETITANRPKHQNSRKDLEARTEQNRTNNNEYWKTVHTSRFDLNNRQTVEKTGALDWVKKRLNLGDVSKAKNLFSAEISSIGKSSDSSANLDNEPLLEVMRKCDTEEKNTVINDGINQIKEKAKAYTHDLDQEMNDIVGKKFIARIKSIKEKIETSGMLNPDQTLTILDPKGNQVDLTNNTEITRLLKEGTLFDISFRVETNAQKDTRNQEQAAKKSEQLAKELNNFNQGKIALKAELSSNLSKQGFNDTEISNISNTMLDENITYTVLMDFNNLLAKDSTNLNKISQALQKTSFSKSDSENLPTKLQNLQDVAKVVLSLPKEWSKDDRANIANAMLNAKFRPEDQKNFDAFIEKNKNTVRTAIQKTIADTNQQINLFTNLLKVKTDTSISSDDFVAFLPPTAKQVQPNTQAEQPAPVNQQQAAPVNQQPATGTSSQHAQQSGIITTVATEESRAATLATTATNLSTNGSFNEQTIANQAPVTLNNQDNNTQSSKQPKTLAELIDETNIKTKEEAKARIAEIETAINNLQGDNNALARMSLDIVKNQLTGNLNTLN